MDFVVNEKYGFKVERYDDQEAGVVMKKMSVYEIGAEPLDVGLDEPLAGPKLLDVFYGNEQGVYAQARERGYI